MVAGLVAIRFVRDVRIAWITTSFKALPREEAGGFLLVLRRGLLCLRRSSLSR